MAREFRILGPLEVVADGQALPLGGAKPRMLLALLLLHANEPVPVDVLAESLWDGTPPPTAAKMIQGYVSQLRKAVGDGVLVTRPSGYLLALDTDELDATRFASQVDDAASRPPADAAAQLRSALQLWRGPPLADFRYDGFAQTEIARLEEARLAAIEARVDADLACGRHAEVVPELEALVTEHPLRERPVEQLMLALYRSGRQADALAVYRRAQQRLDEELGLEPGPDLRGLEGKILRHDAELAAPRRTPVALERIARHAWLVAGVGVLAVAAAAGLLAWQLTRGDGTAAAEAGRGGIAMIDPRGVGPARKLAVPGTPSSLAVGAGSLWALSSAGGTITRIDPRSGRTLGRFTAPGLPTDLAVGAGAIWVVNGRSNGGGLIGTTEQASISRLDLRSAVPTRTTRLPGRTQPSQTDRDPGVPAIAVGGGAVWAIDAQGDVVRLNPEGGIAALVKGLGAAAIAAGAGAIWIDDGGRYVVRIDPRTNRVATRIPLAAGGLDGIAVGAGYVWVADAADGTIWQIDPGPPVVARTIQVGIGVTSLAFAGGAVWAANPFLGSVSRVDPATQTVRTVSVEGTPAALAADRHGAWASVNPVATGPREHGVQALPTPPCRPVVSGGGDVRFLIASDLPLHGSADATIPMTRAIAFVLQQHGFRAGKYSVGYQSCDDSTAQVGNYDFATCGANARVYAVDPAVLGVVGTYTSPCAIAELPITSRTPTGPLAMISPLDTFPDLTHRAGGYHRGLLELLYPTGRRNFVRIIAPDDAQGSGDAVLAHELDASVFVLDDGSSYASGLIGGFVHAARVLHVPIVGTAAWSEQAHRYDAVVEGIARSHARAVFIAGFVSPGTGELIRELRRRLGSKEALIAGDGFVGLQDLIQVAGRAANGVYVSFAGRPNAQLPPVGRAFLRTFGSTQTSSRQTSYAAAYAAQATEVLLSAIARSDGTRASVTKELFAAEVRGGILGSFRFTSDGDMTPTPVTIFRVVGGKLPSSTQLPDFAGSVVDRVIDVPVELVR